MQLGMIGLGRMGGNMVRRLLHAKHQCVVFDRARIRLGVWSAKVRSAQPHLMSWSEN